MKPKSRRNEETKQTKLREEGLPHDIHARQAPSTVLGIPGFQRPPGMAGAVPPTFGIHPSAIPAPTPCSFPLVWLVEVVHVITIDFLQLVHLIGVQVRIGTTFAIALSNLQERFAVKPSLHFSFAAAPAASFGTTGRSPTIFAVASPLAFASSASATAFGFTASGHRARPGDLVLLRLLHQLMLELAILIGVGTTSMIESIANLLEV